MLASVKMSRQKSIENLHVPYDEIKININTSTAKLPSQTPSSMSLVTNVMTENPESEPFIRVNTTEHHTSSYFIAGAAAGIMEHCVMYPVDSIKVVTLHLRA